MVTNFLVAFSPESLLLMCKPRWRGLWTRLRVWNDAKYQIICSDEDLLCGQSRTRTPKRVFSRLIQGRTGETRRPGRRIRTGFFRGQGGVVWNLRRYEPGMRLDTMSWPPSLPSNKLQHRVRSEGLGWSCGSFNPGQKHLWQPTPTRYGKTLDSSVK